MKWREIGILYRMELRSALRERSIVVGSILIPLLLYPLLMWGIMSGLTFVMGQSESQVSRIASSADVESTRVFEALESDERVSVEILLPSHLDIRSRIRSGELDAWIELMPAAAELSPEFRKYHVVYDGSKDRSAVAETRIVESLDSLRTERMEDEAKRAGLGEEVWQQYSVASENLASSRQMGQFIMGLIVPMFLIIMVSAGAMYPAVDATAGERERGTWETLVSTAASPGSIITAKYLYVTTLSCAAGLLNLFAMLVSMRAIFAPMLASTGKNMEFKIPLASIPVIAAGALLLALFISAGMMLLASFARTFKEGQSMAAPLYVVSFLPMLFINSPGIVLTPKLALVPIVNIALVFREAISGTFQWPLIAVAVAVELVLVAAVLLLAQRVLRFEDVLIGSYSGSFFRFLKERIIRRSQT